MDNRFLTSRRTFDADATRYINAVQLADGQALEPEVAMAVNAFVKGCKADSAGYAGDPTRTVWDALQACCIMAGARTISGALVPLVGTAPTAQGGWAAGDYDRATGMKGNGSSLYLDSNRPTNADGQDDQHLAVYATSHHTRSASTKSDIGDATGSSSLSHIVTVTSTRIFRSRSEAVGGFAEATSLAGFQGVNRSDATGFIGRYNQTEYAVTASSATPPSSNVFVFARNVNGTADSKSDARLAFYSIGSSLDLAALDNRVSTLISAIAAALA